MASYIVVPWSCKKVCVGGWVGGWLTGAWQEMVVGSRQGIRDGWHSRILAESRHKHEEERECCRERWNRRNHRDRLRGKTNLEGKETVSVMGEWSQEWRVKVKRGKGGGAFKVAAAYTQDDDEHEVDVREAVKLLEEIDCDERKIPERVL